MVQVINWGPINTGIHLGVEGIINHWWKHKAGIKLINVIIRGKEMMNPDFRLSLKITTLMRAY